MSFKSWSETKKNNKGNRTIISVESVGHEKEGAVQKTECEGLEGMHRKRKKLVRPVFGKKESLNKGLSRDESSNL